MSAKAGTPKGAGEAAQLSFESRLTVPAAAVAPRTATPEVSQDGRATASEPASPEPASNDGSLSAPLRDQPSATPATPATPRIWVVSELLRAARLAIESRFSDVRVEGEISGLKRSGGGHLYFCLKDGQGQLDCVLYGREASRLKFQVEEGMAVRCRGRLTLYEARGRFQMTVADIEPTGAGALALAFEQLKAKLSAEGLFDTARKRALPFLPRRVGVVTSATGAVIRDIVRVAHRRCPVPILLAPTPVQGEGASLAIAAALRRLAAVADVDVIIVARGGGSLEDLWAVNEEPVARAIFACRVPVISAVGHETDFTIADFVADLRAPTPSAAAERAVPVLADLRTELALLGRRAGRATAEHVRARRHTLERARARLGDPRRLLDERRQRLDDAAERAPPARAPARRGERGPARARDAPAPRASAAPRERASQRPRRAPAPPRGGAARRARPASPRRRRRARQARGALAPQRPRARLQPRAARRRPAAHPGRGRPPRRRDPDPPPPRPGPRRGAGGRRRPRQGGPRLDRRRRRRVIRAAVLGADVSKSRSPAIHAAAFRALGVRGTYEALSVDAAGFEALVVELRARGFRYLNVTIPHKVAAARLADARGPEVRASGAANTLLFAAAAPRAAVRTRAENTDGAGLIGALADLDVSPRGARIVMVGAGGAAAGALEALTRAGAQVTLLARRPAAARAVRARLPARQRVRVTVRTLDAAKLEDALDEATALVSAVPAAAWDASARLPLRALGRDTAVLEMAYGGLTPLGAAVRGRTPRYADGLGMLVHQAARAVELALGQPPPLPPLFRAARGR